MKILVDAHVFDGKFQGSRTYIKGLYSALISKQKDWKFYFAGYDVSVLKKEFGEGKNTHYIQLKNRNKLVRLFYEFPQIIKRLKIDFSHFQYISPLIKRGKYIVTTHDILFEEKRFSHFFPKKYKLINGTFFKHSAKKADVLLTVSTYSQQKISELYNIAKDDIHITPNAVAQLDEKTTKDNHIKEEYGIEKYLLYVSRIEPRKNHIAILKAFINLKLHTKGYKVVFIGKQDINDPELDTYIKEHNKILNEHLVQFPNVSGIALQKFYANAACVVYPSFAEGFGIPPLEGAVYGSKVLCSNATAMQDFTFFKYHIDPYNQKEIEESLCKLLEHEDVNIEKTRSLILEKYTWEKSAEVFVKAVSNKVY
ncbi:glycosyltransferase family 4 protein [Patiriisocius hiemis]|uniref:Glycosyltransferase family 1 protein n=1 Tax=Patiriisocius hiemis TaxID=3075604 RepID=A0ABU2YBJ1_9FLAO|nr:glycosyltransferase family 1 protein [Constantimarinum sp. W242]MDT0555564.1 glycosyltransferase family 1 protein [Constantimarinum sp. W242]